MAHLYSISPVVTSVSKNLHRFTSWSTSTELSFDHLPITITIDTKTNPHRKPNKKCYTNYTKANWTEYTAEIDKILSKATPQTDSHNANRTLTDAILTADKHHIPKGKLNSYRTPLPTLIQTKIQERTTSENKTLKIPK